MKCLYAIPSDASDTARELSASYSEALAKLEANVIGLGDDLRAFAEMHGAAVLKLDDEDWASASAGLMQASERNLRDELFWSPTDAERVWRALGDGTTPAASQTVAAWLCSQVSRKRAIVLVSA